MRYPLFLLLAALTAAVLLYLPGLAGGFMLDDQANLAPVWRWLTGDIGWLQVVFGNESGPLGRPVAMLSFAATAALFGQSPEAFKAVNLALHLLVGSGLFLLIGTVASRDPNLRDRRWWFAAGVAAVWLLHPFFTGTVLYVVQRMAILSALFTVFGLWTYARGRIDLEHGRWRRGSLLLFAGVPVFTVLAAFSKETGLLLPLLCAVLEWAYFAPGPGLRRPRAARWFVGLFVALPVAAAGVYLITNPDFFLSGYANRPFDGLERVLTQSRVLFDYVGSLLLPVGQEFSLYRDDYSVSTGLLRPITTLWSILGWIALVALAVRFRRAIPGFSAGIGIFLVGHSMESSIVPLMLYFEHRNYLPGAGVLLAAAAVLIYAIQAVHARLDRPGLVFGAAFAGLLAALSFATYARALAWQSQSHLIEQSVREFPDSRFGRIALAAQIMNDPFGNYDRALEQHRHLQQLELPSTRMIGHIGEMAVTCFARGTTDPENLEQAFSQQPETIQADLLKAVESLSEILRREDCEGLPATAYADRLVDVADRTHLSQARKTVWRLRFEAARLYAHDDENRKALNQARAAWETGAAELPVGMLMAALHIRLEEYGAAARLLDELEGRIPESDRTGRALLEEYRTAIEEGSSRSIFAPGIEG